MVRPFGAALFAFAVIAGTGAIAEARSHAALNPGTAFGLDEASLSALPPPRFFIVPPEASDELRDIDAAANVPAQSADLKMWSQDGGKADPSAMRRFARGIVRRTSGIALSLTRSAMRFIGTPYVFGGTSSSGFDCSGYVQHVFAMFGVRLPRTADEQYYAGARIHNGIRIGDLVFFQTYEPGPSHVGIYIGGGRFVHSSSSRGVTISRIGDRYWAARYLGAKRVVAKR